MSSNGVVSSPAPSNGDTVHDLKAEIQAKEKNEERRKAEDKNKRSGEMFSPHSMTYC